MHSYIPKTFGHRAHAEDTTQARRSRYKTDTVRMAHKMKQKTGFQNRTTRRMWGYTRRVAKWQQPDLHSWERAESGVKHAGQHQRHARHRLRRHRNTAMSTAAGARNAPAGGRLPPPTATTTCHPPFATRHPPPPPPPPPPRRHTTCYSYQNCSAALHSPRWHARPSGSARPCRPRGSRPRGRLRAGPNLCRPPAPRA